jgi:hypothetical protein
MIWKERRKLSYLINEFDDIDLPHRHIDITDQELVKMIVHFFKTESLLIYPAKSYFVAIVYAYCLEKYFNENFYSVLDDPELLIDDMYFIPYSRHKYIYNRVLEQIGDIGQYDSINKTVEYFKQEILWEDIYGTDNQTDIQM